ncbi:hypothetical protein F4802DRAFT_427992 [Xylaria palmicola]|nr:hypothetical protein F4802DRAFT_427992 [Xylaria palmicola]
MRWMREMGGKQEGEGGAAGGALACRECTLIAEWGGGRCTISKTKTIFLRWPPPRVLGTLGGSSAAPGQLAALSSASMSVWACPGCPSPSTSPAERTMTRLTPLTSPLDSSIPSPTSCSLLFPMPNPSTAVTYLAIFSIKAHPLLLYYYYYCYYYGHAVVFACLVWRDTSQERPYISPTRPTLKPPRPKENVDGAGVIAMIKPMLLRTYI